MKRFFLCGLALTLLISATYVYSYTAKKVVVYDEKNGVYIPSGWMGDTNAIKLDNNCTTKPRRGKFCQKWTYSVTSSQKQGWAGVYWQYPSNNWGKKKGYSLEGLKKLTFWVRGDKGGETISIKIGGITGENSDTMMIDLGKKRLSTDWREYTINISGKDLSSVSGGFCWAVDSKDNPKGCVFYFDDIIYD